MSEHDRFCPWRQDPSRGPVHMCAWCDVIAKARADATTVADAMLVQAQHLAAESQAALEQAIGIIRQLRNDVLDEAERYGMPPELVAEIRGQS